MAKRRYARDFLSDAPLRDYVDPESGLRVLVLRGTLSFCAYVGVKADHALAGLEELEFKCHCGITFQTWGRANSLWPEGWYWWGWDYAHCTDAFDLPGIDDPKIKQQLEEFQARLADMFGGLSLPDRIPSKKWTLEEVFEDALDVMMELKEALNVSGGKLRALLGAVGAAAATATAAPAVSLLDQTSSPVVPSELPTPAAARRIRSPKKKS